MRISPWLRYHCDVYSTLAAALEAVCSRKGRATVYLCGGINGLNDAACKDWRQIARDALIPGPGPSRFSVLDPMARDYRGREDECVAEIVDGDKADILASNIVLVNASRPSWGTAMEIMFAWTLHKPVVAFVEAIDPTYRDPDPPRCVTCGHFESAHIFVCACDKFTPPPAGPAED